LFGEVPARSSRQSPAVLKQRGSCHSQAANQVRPHKVWGPQTNDLVLQLRKRRVNQVILAGMLANLCVESHLRELLEQGFEVAVVKDATAAPRHPEIGDGYTAAVINYGFLANVVLTTDDAVKAMR
jgi:nicotinamidase-related amidase